MLFGEDEQPVAKEPKREQPVTTPPLDHPKRRLEDKMYFLGMKAGLKRLVPYATHLDSCDSHDEFCPLECSCGLKQALEELL